MNTNIAIELPEDVARVLREKWGDLTQHTIETLAIEGYQTRALSAAQVRRMLGFQTRMEVDAFLKQHGVYRDYTEADLDRDIETLRQLRQQ
jgi:predicted HTH domain antitoxin